MSAMGRDSAVRSRRAGTGGEPTGGFIIGGDARSLARCANRWHSVPRAMPWHTPGAMSVGTPQRTGWKRQKIAIFNHPPLPFRRTAKIAHSVAARGKVRAFVDLTVDRIRADRVLNRASRRTDGIVPCGRWVHRSGLADLCNVAPVWPRRSGQGDGGRAPAR